MGFIAVMWCLLAVHFVLLYHGIKLIYQSHQRKHHPWKLIETERGGSVRTDDR